MLKVLKKREKRIAFILGVIIILAFIFNLFALPVLNKITALDKEIFLEKNKYSKYKNLLKNKDRIMNLYQSSPIYAQEADETEEGLVSILTRIENLANLSNLKITEIRPDPVKTAILLRAEGDMEGYFKFIFGLESSLSDLNISRFSMSSKSDAEKIQGTFFLSESTLF